MDDNKRFAKNEKELETHKQTENIRSRYINVVMKSGKRCMTEEVELPNQVVVRTFEEKTPTNTLGYWKLTPSNTQKWKKKIKNILDAPENYTRQNSIAETLSKGLIPGQSFFYDTRNNSWNGPEKYLNK